MPATNAELIGAALTNIANAIRAKNGSSDTYTMAEMATAIANLPSGGSGFTHGYANTTSSTIGFYQSEASGNLNS